MSSEIRGVLPVVLMPYTDAGAVDEDDFHSQAEHMFDVGCTGFVVGQVSEVMRLTTAERHRVAQLCAEAAAGRGLSIMSAGGESAESAIDYSLQAQDAGVDALLLMHPSALAMDDDEMVEYFARVIRAVEIPVLVHHAKSMAKQPLSIDAQVRLFEEFGPDRVMFKPEASPTPPRLSALRDATNGQARIFEGDGGMMLLDCYRRGLTGTIPATETAEIVVALWNLLEAGERERAEPIAHRLSYLMCHMMNSIDCYCALGKHLLKRRGIVKATHIRGPVRFHLDPETREEVERIYDGLLDAARAATLIDSRTH